MSETARACAEYFRSRPEFHRLLEAMLKKYRSFGHAAGEIRLPDATQAECDAARSLFGRSFSPPLRIRLWEFEAALGQTRYQGAQLIEVLEAYFDVTIRTNRQQRHQSELRVLELLERVRAGTDSPFCRDWLSVLAEKQDGAAALLRRAAAEDERAAETALCQACQGVRQLEEGPGSAPRLAVLSAQATANPHALDSNTLCGKFFLHLLAHRTGREFPRKAPERLALYYEGGILCDSISSSVTQVGLLLSTGEGEHPAFRAFRLRYEGCTLSLTNLANLAAADSPSGRVYLVENQMVFSQLCDQAHRFHSPLVCTSGEPQVAVLRLLDLLADAGAELYYSGDFDGKGLSIASRFLARYPGRLRLWRMSVQDYQGCVSQEKLPQATLQGLRQYAATPLEETARAMESSGNAGYQELLLDLLQGDLTGDEPR